MSARMRRLDHVQLAMPEGGEEACTGVLSGRARAFLKFPSRLILPSVGLSVRRADFKIHLGAVAGGVHTVTCSGLQSSITRSKLPFARVADNHAGRVR